MEGKKQEEKELEPGREGTRRGGKERRGREDRRETGREGVGDKEGKKKK